MKTLLTSGSNVSVNNRKIRMGREGDGSYLLARELANDLAQLRDDLGVHLTQLAWTDRVAGLL